MGLYSSEGLAGYSLLPASMEFSVGIRPLSQEDLEQLQEQSSPAAVTSLSKPEAARLNDNRDSWLQAQCAVFIPRTLLAPLIPH